MLTESKGFVFAILSTAKNIYRVMIDITLIDSGQITVKKRGKKKK